jgi:hypothetical protein
MYCHASVLLCSQLASGEEQAFRTQSSDEGNGRSPLARGLPVLSMTVRHRVSFELLSLLTLLSSFYSRSSQVGFREPPMMDTDGASQSPHIALMGNARQTPPPVWNPIVAAAMKASINTQAGFLLHLGFLQRQGSFSMRGAVRRYRALLRSFAISRNEDGHYGFLFVLETSFEILGDCIEKGMIYFVHVFILDHKYIGPFPITKIVNPHAYEPELPDGLPIHPVFHTNLLRPAANDPLPGQSNDPQPPVRLDDASQELWEVEAIVDSRHFRKRFQYKIKYTGYPNPTWQPLADLIVRETLLNS